MIVEIVDQEPLGKGPRRNWLLDTAEDIKDCFIRKFVNGQKEHGCDLGSVHTLDLLKEMEQEALDQLAYIREMKRRILK
jgi:hypothetical protein